MAEQPQRRKKVVRTTKNIGNEPAGSRTSVIRPHKKESSADATASAAAPTAAQATTPAAAQAAQAQPQTYVLDLTQIINAFVSNLSANALVDTVWGSNVSRKEATARKIMSIPASDKIFLISEVMVLGSGRVGLALCTSGVRLRDIRGTVRLIPWQDFAKSSLAAQGTTLQIDTNRLALHDATKICALLQQIQAKLPR